ncbi:uncharacterized protein [Nicotiana sylvestris]|uniref:uncharacterized protein n=1 Tax=Nicotiana sylvestris TaxID=4096 RepID=UPI00388CA91F
MPNRPYTSGDKASNEHDRRERLRATVFGKVASKYKGYRTKHHTLAYVLTQDNRFQLFCDRLKQKEKDELEAALKAKEDKFEVSKGVMAENVDLQAWVATLTAELGRREVEVVDLRGELGVKADELARAEKGRVTVVSEVVALEDALRVCRSKHDNEVETSALKVARLEERIQDLEAELSALNKQVVSPVLVFWSDEEEKRKLAQENEALKAQIQQMRRDADKQQRSRSDERLIKGLKKEIGECRDDLKKSKDTIARLQAQWAKRTKERTQYLQQARKDHEKTIVSLKRKVINLESETAKQAKAFETESTRSKALKFNGKEVKSCWNGFLNFPCFFV